VAPEIRSVDAIFHPVSVRFFPAQLWTTKMRYVIFDEVHTLGETGGDVWSVFQPVVS
jgi:hypothetical protein